MCMSRSKRSQADEDSRPMTDETGKAMTKIKCPDDSKPCVWPNATQHCSYGNNLCCYKDTEHARFCKCEQGRYGDFCQISRSEYDLPDNADLLGTQTVAIFSVFLGVAVITLFFVMIVLQIRNNRKYKTLRHIIKTDDNREQNKTAGMGEVKATATDRCFNADPELGDRQVICDQKDNVDANNEPIPVQMPEAAEAIVVVEAAAAAAAAAGEAAAGEAATEDTVL